VDKVKLLGTPGYVPTVLGWEARGNRRSLIGIGQIEPMLAAAAAVAASGRE